MKRITAVGIGLLLLLAVPAAATAAGHIKRTTTGALGAGLDSNIGNTPSGNEPKAQTALDGSLAMAWRMDQGQHTAWQLRASVDANVFAPTSDLSEAIGGVRLRWLHRPGNGFFTPVLAAWVSAGARASASDLRNGTEVRLGGYLREQLTTALSGRLGYTFSKRESESRVYDLTGRTVTLGVDWIATPVWTWYAELEHYNGHIVASVLDSDGLVLAKSYHYLLPAAEEIEEDDAYGENWYALKVPATGTRLGVGFNRPVWAGWSLDSRLALALFNAGEPSHGYSRVQLGATFLKRF